MDQSAEQAAEGVGQTLDHELNLVREAIAMVAAGAAPRVIVGGLHFGEALLATAGGLAAEAGVRLVPLWMPDDAGADIAIERIDHA
jgi:hypothetical protein